jgi:glutaryl-CoA dehydrogenase (non-decarboxylating)
MINSDFKEKFDSSIYLYISENSEAIEKDCLLSNEVFRVLSESGTLKLFSQELRRKNNLSYFDIQYACEMIGMKSASLLSALTVHSMACEIIDRWGSTDQKNDWLPKLTSGELIGGFALSEPDIGSDANNITTTLSETENGFSINGKKTWISLAQRADVFVVFAKSKGGNSAVIVDRNAKGLEVTPIQPGLGFRSAMMGTLSFNECIIPKTNLIGTHGVGVSHIASSGLNLGRFTIASGCIGLAQECLNSSYNYANSRVQSDVKLIEHQFIQSKLTNMIVQTKAARELCHKAAELKKNKDPASIYETQVAKYFAATMLSQITNDCIQIHGAKGFMDECGLARLFRDAKAMEIIEGSTQLQQTFISKNYEYF